MSGTMHDEWTSVPRPRTLRATFINRRKPEAAIAECGDQRHAVTARVPVNLRRFAGLTGIAMAVTVALAGCGAASTPSVQATAGMTPSRPTSTPTATPSPALTNAAEPLKQTYSDAIVLMNIGWSAWVKAAGPTSNSADAASSTVLKGEAVSLAQNLLAMNPRDGSDVSNALSDLTTQLNSFLDAVSAAASDPTAGFLVVFVAQKVRTSAAVVRRLLHLPALGSFAKALV
jgi:hypothetical protein